MKMRWLDKPESYGAVSRLLHWSMAAVFAFQFLGMALLVVLGEIPLTKFFLGLHPSLGTLLFLLICLRLAWSGVNARRRPSYGASISDRLARLGHAALYVLMLVVPLLALLRSFGSGRAFALFGIPLWGATEDKIEWMAVTGDAAHGLLAWVLLAMIAGHAAAAIWHRLIQRDNVWQRMI